ncbi:MAG: EamA family transporter [Saprospiraceae bacterium]|nr:EamA family transporter [Saprospiraceae bacterium]
MANWVYIFVLAIACTTVAWVLSLYALRHLSAFENNLVVNLEPVYGILLAAAILQEHKELNAGFYVGGSIILVLVLAYPTVKRKLVAQSI